MKNIIPFPPDSTLPRRVFKTAPSERARLDSHRSNSSSQRPARVPRTSLAAPRSSAPHISASKLSLSSATSSATKPPKRRAQSCLPVRSRDYHRPAGPMLQIKRRAVTSRDGDVTAHASRTSKGLDISSTCRPMPVSYNSFLIQTMPSSVDDFR